MGTRSSSTFSLRLLFKGSITSENSSEPQTMQLSIPLPYCSPLWVSSLFSTGFLSSSVARTMSWILSHDLTQNRYLLTFFLVTAKFLGRSGHTGSISFFLLIHLLNVTYLPPSPLHQHGSWQHCQGSLSCQFPVGIFLSEIVHLLLSHFFLIDSLPFISLVSHFPGLSPLISAIFLSLVETLFFLSFKYLCSLRAPIPSIFIFAHTSRIILLPLYLQLTSITWWFSNLLFLLRPLFWASHLWINCLRGTSTWINKKPPILNHSSSLSSYIFPVSEWHHHLPVAKSAKPSKASLLPLPPLRCFFDFSVFLFSHYSLLFILYHSKILWTGILPPV